MTHLQKYIDEKNLWRRTAKQPLLNINNPTQKTVDDIRDMIECDLSPENVCCDGEATMRQVAVRINMLQGALKELNAIKVNYKG